MTYRRKEQIGDATLYLGDCLDVLRDLPGNSIDAIVTDPPYGLSFMGRHWDHGVPSGEVWEQCLRLLKPGGHLLAFAGTRTQHRMAINIEDAGFEIRDMIAWVYGSGFPNSLDVSKAIDKAAGAEREVVGVKKNNKGNSGKQVYAAYGSFDQTATSDITAPATEAAKQWDGWGTALKPALEPITVARKPFKGTVAANVLEHGTGALNVDGCRVGSEPPAPRDAPKKVMRGGKFHAGADVDKEMSHYNPTQGRWPANLIHDGSDEVVGLFPVSKDGVAGKRNGVKGATDFDFGAYDNEWGGYGGGGSAARFFYCAKASKRDRDEGCEGMEKRKVSTMNGYTRPSEGRTADKNGGPKRNHHPTVKPTDLMRYLVRLVTPPGGLVLDPFMGSGSTGKACALEGLGFIGIEREQEYHQIAIGRVHAVSAQGRLFA